MGFLKFESPVILIPRMTLNYFKDPAIAGEA